jgi:hypothetical protein
MSAAERYQARLAFWSDALGVADARALVVSRLRLVSFLGGVALLAWGLHEDARAPAIAGAVLVAVFAVLVVVHARLLRRVDEAKAGVEIAEQSLAQLARNWSGLAEIHVPLDFDLGVHPYARDLGVVGHASLSTWLGRAATPAGMRHLWNLLMGVDGAATVPERQDATGDLAGRERFREALLIEGRLSAANADELSGFLAWAESRESALPPALRPIAIALPLVAWFFIAVWFNSTRGRLPPLTADTLRLWIDDLILSGWWLWPVMAGVVLSFAFARRIATAFENASLGGRGLERYAAMLRRAEQERWESPRLRLLGARLQDGASASSRIAQLSRRVGFAELRTGAALLHFPIQALTMWDFHVVFALERWRAACGFQVRGWLEALGEIDALAVLSRPGADHPDWAAPSVDPRLDSVAAAALGHPLIPQERRIVNDVTIGPAGRVLLVTGSNMSGKSTLLRALGLNIVLARAGSRVCAAAFAGPPVDLQTSIYVQDSLENGISYFMAALTRLKQIVDAAERDAAQGQRLLYLLDEILQGTNSAERGIAVQAIVRHLLEAGAIGAMTTHDLALAAEEPLKSHAVLVHFTEQVDPDGTMTFDYQLRQGLATSTNALRLMQAIGIAPR